MTAPPRKGIAARLVGLIFTARCLSCGEGAGAGRLLCAGCELRLDQARPLRGAPPAGVDRVTAAAEHAGVARQLVTALKFHRRLGAADVMAARLAPLLSQAGQSRQPGEGAAIALPPLVPVPSAPWRQRRRGFNPAAELATALGRQLSTGTVDCLRRHGEMHQLGRDRGARRAPGFEIVVEGVAPPGCILIDDVMTTGGTLTACAIALRRAGTREIMAATFTRRP